MLDAVWLRIEIQDRDLNHEWSCPHRIIPMSEWNIPQELDRT
jgi:hypothetical protein